MTSPIVGSVCLPLPRSPWRPDGPPAVPSVVVGPPPVDPDARARYRWWLGHQLTFFVWRLLTESLTAIVAEERPSPERVATAAGLYDAYSVLLLYAGSCSPQVYGRTIRPEMARADPAFSGRWARDYEGVPGLLRTVRSTPEAGGLIAAARTNQMTHIAMARYLVPDGHSLLQKSDRGHDQPVTDRERDIFDAFFLVTRSAISRAVFTAQLDALTGLIVADLADQPLDQDISATTIRFQQDAAEILRSVPEHDRLSLSGRTAW